MHKLLADSLQGKSHIIWDWNGTLVSDVHHAVETMNGLLAPAGLPLITVESYREFFEFPVINYYRRLGFDPSQEAFEELSHRFVAGYMDGFRSLSLVEGMRGVLEAMRGAKKKQSILSAADQESLSEMVNHYELDGIFDHVFGLSDKFAHSKVERGHELIRVANVAAENTVLVGDTLHDLEVGQALGVDVILVAHGHQTAEKLRSKHHLVLGA